MNHLTTVERRADAELLSIQVCQRCFSNFMERTESSSFSNTLSRLTENGSYLHIQVCEILIYPTGRWGDCQSIKRTLDTSPTLVQDVGVSHCRAHVIVSEKLLNRSDIVPVFQQVRCKGVAQGVIILLTNCLCRRSTTDIIPFVEQKSKWCAPCAGSTRKVL